MKKIIFITNLLAFTSQISFASQMNEDATVEQACDSKKKGELNPAFINALKNRDFDQAKKILKNVVNLENQIYFLKRAIETDDGNCINLPIIEFLLKNVNINEHIINTILTCFLPDYPIEFNLNLAKHFIKQKIFSKMNISNLLNIYLCALERHEEEFVNFLVDMGGRILYRNSLYAAIESEGSDLSNAIKTCDKRSLIDEMPSNYLDYCRGSLEYNIVPSICAAEKVNLDALKRICEISDNTDYLWELEIRGEDDSLVNTLDMAWQKFTLNYCDLTMVNFLLERYYQEYLADMNNNGQHNFSFSDWMQFKYKKLYNESKKIPKCLNEEITESLLKKRLTSKKLDEGLVKKIAEFAIDKLAARMVVL